VTACLRSELNRHFLGTRGTAKAGEVLVSNPGRSRRRRSVQLFPVSAAFPHQPRVQRDRLLLTASP